jgi:hypothetical protein
VTDGQEMAYMVITIIIISKGYNMDYKKLAANVNRAFKVETAATREARLARECANMQEAVISQDGVISFFS